MNDHLREMLKDLGQAINESISGSGRVHDSIQRIRDEGYNLYMVLDAKVGVNRREAKAREGRLSRRKGGRVDPIVEKVATGDERAAFRINIKDVRILKSLGIDPTRKVRLRASMVRRASAPGAPRRAVRPAFRPPFPFRSYTHPVTPPREALGLSAANWDALALEWGLPRYRGRQVFDAIHRRGARDYAAVRELPGDLRERLALEVPILLPEIARREEAADGSIKYGLRLSDGALVEAVFMPGDSARSAANEFGDARDLRESSTSRGQWESPKSKVQSMRSEAKRSFAKEGPKSTEKTERFTVCLSSQTGCAVDCVFCVTGRLGGGRNLTAGEIVGQLDAVLDDAGRSMEGLRIVFMGMGEPFLNPDGVIGALEVLFELLAPRRVTVSTSGITPAFERFAALPKRPNLAVSINASDEETRTAIMPITRYLPSRGARLRDARLAARAAPQDPRRVRADRRRQRLERGRREAGPAPRRLARESQRDSVERGPGLPAGLEAPRRRVDRRFCEGPLRCRRHGHGPAQQRTGYRRRVRAAEGTHHGPEEEV